MLHGGRGPSTKECRQSLEDGEVKETEFSLEPPESSTVLLTLIFNLVKPMLGI